MSDELAEIIARIDARLKVTGKTDRATSLEATGAAHTIRNMRNGSMPGLPVLTKLAGALDTSPQFLVFGVAADEASQHEAAANGNLKMIGRVAAGKWLTIDTDVDVASYDGPTPPLDPTIPEDWQFAVEVDGTSVNRVAAHGAILGCVDTRQARMKPREGELVIVEQRREGGHEIMRTAKRFHVVEGGYELRPDSTDPVHQPIVIRHDDEAEDACIEVIGIVTGVYAPLATLDRARRIT